MTYPIDDPRWSALWRYHDRSLEVATQLLGLSSISVVDRDTLYDLNVRWFIQIQDLVHDFAYSARKGIEITADIEPATLVAAKEAQPHATGQRVQVDIDRHIDLCDQSFWWIINRLIHSRKLTVQEVVETIVGGPWALPHQTSSRVAPRFVGFRSDYDDREQFNYVGIQELVACYISPISRKVDALLEIRKVDPFAAP